MTKSNQHIFAKKLIILFVAILIIAIAGFYRSYFQYFPFINENISATVHLHAIFMLLWLILLIIQPLLIVSGKRSFHKTLGKYSWILMSLIILSSMSLIAQRFFLDASKDIPLVSNIAIRMVSVITMVSFVTFYVLAIRNTRNMAVHARYIIGTGLAVVPAAATRLLYFLEVNSILAEFSALIIINLLVFGLIMIDKHNGLTLKEKPYHVILAFQLFLTAYYCLLLGLTFA